MQYTVPETSNGILYNLENRMKHLTKNLTASALGLALLTAAALSGNAQSVGVDPSKPWGGWMNVYDLAGGNAQGGYLWGSGWGTADLPAVISGGTLSLSPNVSTWNSTDAYWVTPGGQPNKWMEANFLVDAGTSFAGSALTFSGSTIANTLASPYSAVAFIKEFTAAYGWVGMDSVPLVGGAPFSVSRSIGAGNVAQYGFMTLGPNANPATVGALGQVSLAVIPEPAGFALLSLGILGLAAWRRRVA
jgi:hypothetical protein